MATPLRRIRHFVPRLTSPSCTMTPAMLPNLEERKISRISGVGGDDLLVFRLEHALEGGLDVFDRLVDDRVVLDLDAFTVGQIRHLTVRAHVEADDDGLVDGREVDVVLGDRADAAVDDLDADLVGHLDLHQGVFQRLDGTGGVALDDDVEHVHLGLGELLLEAFERDDLAAFRELRLARSVAWRFSAIWRAVRSSDATRKRSPAVGTDVETQHLHGRGRGGFLHVVAVRRRAWHAREPYEVPATMASPMRRVPLLRRARSPQRRGPCRVGLRRWRLGRPYPGSHRRSRSASAVSSTASSSLSDIGALLGGNVDEHGVAAVLLRHEAELGELATDLLRVRARPYRPC